jgi:hypothetical protein
LASRSEQRVEGPNPFGCAKGRRILMRNVEYEPIDLGNHENFKASFLRGKHLVVIPSQGENNTKIRVISDFSHQNLLVISLGD